MAETVQISENRRFDSYPGDHIIMSWKEHLKETGQPTTFRFLTQTKPPPDAEFEELTGDVEVPTKLREKVGKSPCPICSPNKPKFFKCRLCWFPEEGVLRVIGFECANTYLGTEANTAAVMKRRRREKKKNAEDYLLETLPKIGEFKRFVIVIQDLARGYDNARRLFRRYGTQLATTSLARVDKGKGLPLFEKIETTTVDRYGEQKTVFQEREEGHVKVEGLNHPGFTGDCLVLLKRLYRARSCLHSMRPLPQLA